MISRVLFINKSNKPIQFSSLEHGIFTVGPKNHELRYVTGRDSSFWENKNADKINGDNYIIIIKDSCINQYLAEVSSVKDSSTDTENVSSEDKNPITNEITPDLDKSALDDSSEPASNVDNTNSTNDDSSSKDTDSTEPISKYNTKELSKLKLAELKSLCQENDIENEGFTKAQCVEALLKL